MYLVLYFPHQLDIIYFGMKYLLLRKCGELENWQHLPQSYLAGMRPLVWSLAPIKCYSSCTDICDPCSHSPSLAQDENLSVVCPCITTATNGREEGSRFWQHALYVFLKPKVIIIICCLLAFIHNLEKIGLI